jgi:hypothetical protein
MIYDLSLTSVSLTPSLPSRGLIMSGSGSRSGFKPRAETFVREKIHVSRRIFCISMFTTYSSVTRCFIEEKLPTVAGGETNFVL